MAIFREEKTIKAKKSEQISIKVVHQNIAATESYHIVDIPGNTNFYDFEWENENTVLIGNSEQFIGKTVMIYSKAVNLNSMEDEIKINFYVNDVTIYEHQNPKNENSSPSIIITVNFAE